MVVGGEVSIALFIVDEEICFPTKSLIQFNSHESIF